ncbi:hypothetical protein ACFLU6_15675, partial [Acidobacteriota bacterium]
LSGDFRDVWGEAIGQRELGRLLACRGEFKESERALDRALSMFKAQGNEQGQCIACSYHAQRALFLGDPICALEILEEAKKHWELDAAHDYPVERDFIQIQWLSGLAKLAGRELTEAETELTDTLTRCRRIRLVEYEADILLALARLRWEQGAQSSNAFDEAAKLTNEALEIACRYEHRLKQADLHNFLARLALSGGDQELARKQAEKARDRAFCDGPPHYYKNAFIEAETLLNNLAG